MLPLGLFNEGCRARPRILNALQAAERPHRLVFSSSHMAGLLSAVEAGTLADALARLSGDRVATHLLARMTAGAHGAGPRTGAPP